jgi:gliding motility-associated-like protein
MINLPPLTFMKPGLLKYFLLSVSIIFFSCNGIFAQDFSNRGKDFWLAYPAHIDGTGSVMGIYITSDVNASGTITVGATVISFTVTANTVTRKFLGPNAAGDAPNTGVHLTTQDGIETAKGIRIQSDNPVVVYSHIIRSARSGATLVLPVAVLGREYTVPSYRNTGGGGQGANAGIGEMVVVATEANTIIEVTPSVSSRNGARAAGVPYTITLANPGDVYQVQFQQHADISGTVVRSIATAGATCKKIAVFSATTWSAFDCTVPAASGGDNLFQQLFPMASWGKNFLTAPFRTKSSDIIRVFVRDASTVVQKTESGVTTTLTGLINGSYYEFTTGNPTSIICDKPASVVMYIRSQTCQTPNVVTDPEMVLINPVEQTINDITVFSAHQNFVPAGQSQVTNHYLNIIIKSNATASFRINGAPPASAFVPIPGTLYSYLQEDISARVGTNPVSNLKADSAFIAIAYGFGNFESYGYNAGTNVRDLFQFISTKNQLGTAPFPAACVNSPFDFSITFPYQPDSIRWDFNGLFTPVAFSKPAADSSYLISGRNVYLYKIPVPYTVSAIGTYPVKVYARNPIGDGCNSEQEINFSLQVFNPPAASFSWNSKGCVDSTITFTSANNTGGRPIIKHFWDFGDGTFAYTDNPTKKYNAPGKYTIKYSVLTDVGCLSDTLSKDIFVTNTPTAKFGFTNPQCLGKQIVFGDTSKLTGNYGSIVSWNWNLGNGNTFNNPNANNVSTSYPGTLTYTASLQVTTNTGCVSPLFSLPIKVNPNPVPNFTNQYACLPDGVVNFTGTSTIADGTQNLFSYNWNFGDAATGPLNNAVIKDPSHKYATTGPYNVKLIVTSNNGCIDSITKAVANIYPQPKTNFNLPAEVCYLTPVTFTDATNGFTHPVTQWQWRFKNSGGTVIASSNVKDPVFNFPAPGTYTVQHWAFTNQNCVSDTVEKQIIINPWPTAAITLSTIACEKNQVTFTDNSTPNAGNLVRWYWNLGDGTVINAANGNPVTHTYTVWGTKNIKMLVESSKGCRSDTLRQQILINPLPKPGVIIPEVCLQDGFATFIDTSKIEDGSASQLKYLWTFNTGTPPVVPAPTPITSTLKNPTIQFFKSDNYQFNLVTESKDGCRDSINNVPFTINGVIAKTDFAILPTNGICSNKEVEIQNKSSVVFGWLTKLEIYWDYANNPTQVFVDDDPVPGEIYKHQYPNFQSPLTKTFRVRMRAFSGQICEKDTIQDIIVNASPLTTFALMPGICVDAVPRQITQAVETGGLPGIGIFTGPGVSATGLFNPSVAGVGTHTIRYTFTAANGCVHFSEQSIEVYPRPVAQLQALLPNCEKNSITFNSNGSVANATNLAGWSWNFGDGTPAVTAVNNSPVPHTYAAYGNYTVSLTVTNNRGCNSMPQPLNITVHPLPRVNFELPKICLPDGSGQFTDRSTIPDNTSASFKYKWDFGNQFAVPANSDTSILKNPVYKYSNLGPFTVKLIVTSTNNCVDSLVKQLVDVFPQPKAKFSTDADSICIGEVIEFTDESDGIVGNITRWKWSFGNGDSSFIQNPRYRYPSPAITPFNVKLHVFSEQGCVSDTAEQLISVWAYPLVSAGPDFTMLQDGVRTISDAKSTGIGLQYLWSPATYLNNVTLANPTIVKPQDDITYTVTVTGRGGCTNSDDVFVKILKTPKPPNTFTPNGDGVNDFWEIQYLNDYPGCVIEVYNTAGSLVYRSVGYTTPWDGKFKGQPLPAGTYYYVIDPKNGRSRVAGYVTILR